MAGERYAKLTIRAAWSWNDSIRGYQTRELRFKLGGQWVTVQRGGNPDQLTVPDPDDGAGRLFVVQALNSLRGILLAYIARNGLSYAISAVRDLGDDPDHPSGVADGVGNAWPLAEFDIEAGLYLPALDLDFQNVYDTYGGWAIVRNLPTLQPIQLVGTAVPATVYGSATGQAGVMATGGNQPPFTYQWADQPGPGVSSRSFLVGPRTYSCTVTDASGVSATVDVVVGADPRLQVVAATTGSSITLQVSGGVAPYAYYWADAGTGPVRTSLAPGTYFCRVSDSRGAVRDVEVTLVTQPYYWSGNAITLALDAGDDYRADPTSKPGLTFLCEVWVEPTYGSDVFVQVGPALEQPADPQGRTVFQVQALLEPWLDYHVPAPDLGAPERATPLFRRFYLRHAQQYGTPPLPEPVTALEHHYVLRGGLSFHQAAARTWFTSYQAQVQPFLTWEPNDKWVLPDQPEFLYFQVPPDAADLRVRVDVQVGQPGGLAAPVQLSFPLAGAQPWEVYCLPVGYAGLALAELAGGGRRVTAWQVQVVDAQGVAWSEVRRYSLDSRTFPRRRYLLFATSLGGMATYAALGDAQLDAEVTGEEAARTLLPNYEPLAGDVQVLSRALRPVVKLASGPRTRAQQAAGLDLLLSRRVLLLADGGARWQPGTLKAKTSTYLDEGKATQTQELEFTLPTETFYTPTL